MVVTIFIFFLFEGGKREKGSDYKGPGCKEVGGFCQCLGIHKNTGQKQEQASNNNNNKEQ